jgi:tRNA nucleotidyltransferase (CCA-adding enzyme)
MTFLWKASMLSGYLRFASASGPPGWGHKQFDVQSGPEISIEEDQARRDFLMNAVAVRLTTGEVIAHPGAIEDIRARRISVINGRQSFMDDPLRMLRAAQFASRFGFDIDPATLALMRDCAHMIAEERRCQLSALWRNSPSCW